MSRTHTHAESTWRKLVNLFLGAHLERKDIRSRFLTCLLQRCPPRLSALSRSLQYHLAARLVNSCCKDTEGESQPTQKEALLKNSNRKGGELNSPTPSSSLFP